jgi:hypothetical protein
MEIYVLFKVRVFYSSVLYLIKHGLLVFQMAYKNEPSDEFIGEVLLKINVVKRRKSKLKFMQMNMILSHIKPPTRQ